MREMTPPHRANGLITCALLLLIVYSSMGLPGVDHEEFSLPRGDVYLLSVEGTEEGEKYIASHLKQPPHTDDGHTIIIGGRGGMRK